MSQHRLLSVGMCPVWQCLDPGRPQRSGDVLAAEAEPVAPRGVDLRTPAVKGHMRAGSSAIISAPSCFYVSACQAVSGRPLCFQKHARPSCRKADIPSGLCRLLRSKPSGAPSMLPKHTRPSCETHAPIRLLQGKPSFWCGQAPAFEVLPGGLLCARRFTARALHQLRQHGTRVGRRGGLR